MTFVSGRPVGRPTKLTPDVHERIVAAVRAGNYWHVAAEYAGVGERTLAEWRARGAEIDEDVQRISDAGGEVWLSDWEIAVWNLHCDLMKADAEMEVRIVTQWANQVGDDWRAGKELLARRHPDRWRERTSMELGGIPDGIPIGLEGNVEHTLDVVTPERTRNVLDALAEAGVIPELPADDG